MSSERLRIAAAVGLVALVCFGVYAGSLGAPFLWDDHHAIEENPHLRSLWPLGGALGAPEQSTVAGRPVPALTLALNYAAFGMDVRAFRAVNIVVHLACALVLFGLGRRVWSPAAGVSIALVWAAHPLCSETVIYVVQRTEGLMTLFYLLTLYACVRAGDTGGVRWSAIAVVACALGMASKESMVTAPVVVVLWDLSFTSETWRAVAARRWRLWSALAATWMVLAALMIGGPRSDTVGFAIGTTAVGYALNQAIVVLDYLRHAVWPGVLVFDYGFPRDVELRSTLPALAIVGLLAAGAVALWRRHPRAGFLAVAPFLILAPTSSIVPIVTEVGAERRMYLPLAALVALAVVALHAATTRRGVVAGIVALSVVALGARTVARTRDYATSEAIWTSAVAARPLNSRAHENLGQALQLQGRTDEAIARYEHALELMPDNFMTHYNLGSALVEAGRQAEGVARYGLALELRPDHVESRLNLGSELANRGAITEALVHFREAARLAPSVADIHFRLGRALRIAGLHGDATAALGRARRLAPDDASIAAELAWLVATSPDPDVRDSGQAVELARRALAAGDPGDPLLLDTLAAAEAAAGRFESALELARRARAAATSSTLVSEIERRIEAYSAGRPWFEPATP